MKQLKSKITYEAENTERGAQLRITTHDTTVGEYDATTGAAINANFITGLNQPTGLLVASVQEPSTWSMIAVGGVALLAMMHGRKHRIV